jgi:hypothetical protein
VKALFGDAIAQLLKNEGGRYVDNDHGRGPSRGIRPGTPLSLEDARRQGEGYVEHYNDVR